MKNIMVVFFAIGMLMSNNINYETDTSLCELVKKLNIEIIKESVDILDKKFSY